MSTTSPDEGAEPRSEELRRARRYLDGDTVTVRDVEGWIAGLLRGRYGVLRNEWDDLSQAIHQKLLIALRGDRFEGRSSLQTYVRRITHSVAIDRLRVRYRDRPLDEASPEERAATEPSPYSIVRDQERHRLLHRVLARSSEACRRLWRWALGERLTQEQIGERLGIPTGTVKSRLYHCRQRALRILEELGG